jgi:hypothetical protein
LVVVAVQLLDLKMQVIRLAGELDCDHGFPCGGRRWVEQFLIINENQSHLQQHRQTGVQCTSLLMC